MRQSPLIEPEIIDLGPGFYSKEEYEDCLTKLDQIGRWLGGDRATFVAMQKINPSPRSILDVGCGGGEFTIRLAQQYPKACIVGIDLNPQAIEFAKKRLALTQNPPTNLIFKIQNQKQLEEDKSYDVVMTTLVCHHMTDDELVEFLKQACRIAKQRVILNDLHRHAIAYYFFKVASPLFFRNRLVQHDGLVSIKRSFDRKEWVRALEQTGLAPSQYNISWHWAFRWIVEIYCEEKAFCFQQTA